MFPPLVKEKDGREGGSGAGAGAAFLVLFVNPPRREAEAMEKVSHLAS